MKGDFIRVIPSAKQYSAVHHKEGSVKEDSDWNKPSEVFLKTDDVCRNISARTGVDLSQVKSVFTPAGETDKDSFRFADQLVDALALGEEAVFSLDRETGEATFGDGLRGRIPDTGKSVGASYTSARAAGAMELADVQPFPAEIAIRTQDYGASLMDLFAAAADKMSDHQDRIAEEVTTESSVGGKRSRLGTDDIMKKVDSMINLAHSLMEMKSELRNRYFSGKLLTETDFKDEQSYNAPRKEDQAVAVDHTDPVNRPPLEAVVTENGESDKPDES